MVQAIASSQPPPSAKPLMQAITGLPRFSMASTMAWPRWVYSLAETGVCCDSSPMSAPATNAFSPAPVRMTTRTSASSFTAAKAVFSSCMVAMFSALSTFGRSMVM